MEEMGGSRCGPRCQDFRPELYSDAADNGRDARISRLADGCINSGPCRSDLTGYILRRPSGSAGT